MKRYFNITALLILLVATISGCEKDENQVIFQGGTPSVLSVSFTGDTVLTIPNKTRELFTLRWTNPNYNFNTGPSSHNVTYTIQVDTAGSNFTNPARQDISVSSDLSKTFTVDEFNKVLTRMGLTAGRPYNIDVRILPSINGAVQLNSNVIRLRDIVPFEDFVVPAPASNSLFITGAATPGGWQAGVSGEAVPANQQFVQKSRALYEIPRIFLNGGQSYLLLPVYGSWATKYGGLKGNNENNPMEDDFKENGSDLKAPAESGFYKIEVNFQSGKIKLTKL